MKNMSVTNKKLFIGIDLIIRIYPAQIESTVSAYTFKLCAFNILLKNKKCRFPGYEFQIPYNQQTYIKHLMFIFYVIY